MNGLDVSLDPACGLALIPFCQAGELAWFLFDLFAPQGVAGWAFTPTPWVPCGP